MIKKLFTKIVASKRPSGKLNFTNLQSILIYLTGRGLGDAIVLTAIIRQLRTTYPNAKIGVISHSRNEIIFKNNPLQVELIPMSIFYALTHRNQWQLFVDCSPRFTTKGLLFSFLLNFAYVICFEKEEKKYYNKRSVNNYNEYIICLEDVHLSKYLLLTGLKNYLKDNSSQYILPKIEKEDDDIVSQFIEKNKLNIMVCPFGTTRKLDPYEFRTICSLALEGNESKVHLMFPKTLQTHEYLLPNSKIMQTVLPTQTVSQWFCLISKADLVIAVDSAAVHVAGAYKKPLIAFYGGRKPFIQFAPLSYTHAIAIAPMHSMPKNFNGTMKGYDCNETSKKLKELISILTSSSSQK